MWTKIKRVFKSGFRNFIRNGSVSVASTLVMVVTLSVIASLILVGATLNSTLQSIKNKVDINVYFVQGADENSINNLKKNIEALPEVDSTAYTSAADALTEFKERHKDSQTILNALDEINTNPLGASLNIRAKNPSQYQTIADYIATKDISVNGSASIIEKVNYSQNKTAIDTLNKIITSSEKLGGILALFFALISILITFNTIRLAIYISKDEISVMRLVGASNNYVRGPFVVAGILYGLIASIITVVLLYPITYWLGPMTYTLGTNLNIFEYYISNLWQISLAVFASGLFLGMLSSFLAVKKYLKI